MQPFFVYFYLKQSAMKQLLVPFDFSVESDHALDFACKIAHEKDFFIDVLHILKLPLPQVELSDFDLTTYQRECKELNWNRLSSYLSQKKFEAVKIRINQVVIEENESIDELISSVISKNQSDLVIIGNKQVSGLLEEVNDSIAAKVMKGITIPIIAIKGFLPLNQINNILYTFEFEKDDTVKFEFVKLIADIFDSKVNFLYVKETTNKSQNEKEILLHMKQLSAAWKLNKCDFYIRESEDYQSEIFSFIDENNIDLVVIGYHDTRTEKHQQEGSIAEDLIHAFPCPVLTLKYAL